MRPISLATLLTGALLTSVALAAAGSVYDIPLKTLDGKPASLGAWRGKVILVVNVASKCGYTRQYAPLEKIYREYKDRGLVVVGVPSNDFGGQEPGSPEEIRQFCTSRFDVTFPLMEKVHVRPGPDQHPLYQWLTGEQSPFPGPVKWNFNKFLIGRDGRLLARFDSKVEPDSPEMREAIEKALGTK